MAEVLVSALLSVLMKKATDQVLGQFGVMWGITDKLEELERKLLAIQRIIGNAEERQGEGDVKRWLEALKDTAYQADDILDEFNVDVMRLNQAGMTKKVRNFFSSYNPVWFRFQIGRKLNDITGEIDKIKTEGDQFHFTATIQPQNRDRRPQTHSYVDESTVIGREEDKEKIVKLLLDHDNSQRVAVLPIVGMGGLGKTTLAKLVYKDKRVEEHFQQMLIWVCVSDEFELEKLAKAIITSATGEECQLSTMELLQRRLRHELSGKRYFLVLDDVWNNDSEKWNELKTLLETGKEGSKIIVTTRSDEVARIMGTIPTHYPQQLNEKDSWTLFKKRAFKDRVEEPQNLVSIGKDIVKKCDGLPLALNVMGGLMHSKSQEEAEWLSVKNSEIWNLPDADKILSVLRLSYRDLPSHLKQCFAFCAIFPKDHVMEKKQLIQLWMANGFIPPDEGQELEEKGNDIFKELAWRSFFQDIKEVEEEYDVLYGKTTCKMHDLMHDLAQSIMGNECPSSLERVSEHISKKIRHLCLHRCSRSDGQRALNNSPNIRTLLMPDRSSTIVVTGDSLKSLPLRAWELHDAPSITQLFNAIRFPKHLRYLDLSLTAIEALPTSTLFNLQTLKLSNCRKLRKLPDGMKNMSNLRHLYIDGCDNLNCLPRNMGQLSNLRTLSKYIVGNEDGRRIGELNGLNLGGKLELYNLRNVKDTADAEKADLKSKCHLCSLLLCWDMNQWPTQVYHEEDVESAENAEKVLEGLRLHVGLKKLEIFYYRGTSFPMWMKELQNLTEICLEYCTGCEHLPPLWQYPSLKLLYLHRMDKIKYICSGNRSNGTVQTFPSLKRLMMIDMQSLEAWLEDEGTAEAPPVFPYLTRLIIIRCPNLKTMPKLPPFEELMMSRVSIMLQLPDPLDITNIALKDIRIAVDPSRGEMPFRHLKSLEDLSIRVFENDRASLLEEETRVLSTSLHDLKFEDINGSFSSLQQSSSPLGFWKNLTSLQGLEICRCDDLVYWPEEEFRGLNSLKKLRIRSCRNFIGSSRSPSSFSSSGDGELLPNLKELEISDCDGLLKLPKLPTSLILLQVDRCANLISLMEGGLQHVTALEGLCIYNCRSLTSLPEDLSSLTALQNLFISNCGSLTSLPEDLSSLTALQNLSISNCGSLTSLPGDLSSLTVLQKLSISNCGSLTSLLGDLGSLIALQYLSISDFGSLTSLPGHLGSLTALQSLSISNCGSLTSLPGDLGSLTALQGLSISNCGSLTSLPGDLGSLTALQGLSISNCGSLTSLPGDLGCLTALQNLSISDCNQLSSLPEGLQQRLSGLRYVNIQGCPNLKDRHPYSGVISKRSTSSTFLPSFRCFRRASI